MYNLFVHYNVHSICRAGMSGGQITVVGSGLIGRCWAVLYSRGGYKVVLHDVKEDLMEQALENIHTQLNSLHESGLLMGW